MLGGIEATARLRADTNARPGEVSPSSSTWQGRACSIPERAEYAGIALMAMTRHPDIVIVGSGIGGATMAAGLAGSGARDHRSSSAASSWPTARQRATRGPSSSTAISGPKEMWRDGRRCAVQSRQLLLCRRQFEVLRRGADALPRARISRRWSMSAASRPPGRSPMTSWSPGTRRPSSCFSVRGALGEDPTEPLHSRPYPLSAGARRAADRRVRERLKRVGLHPFSLPLGVDIERWLQRAATPWDAFPNTAHGKMDAETAPLAQALQRPERPAGDRRVRRAPDRRRRTAGGSRASTIGQDGERRRAARRHWSSCRAGAVNSAAILLRSRHGRLRTASPTAPTQVGRNFMNHNCTADAGDRSAPPQRRRLPEDAGLNDFYLADGEGGTPLGNVQLLGKIDGADPQGQPAAGRRNVALDLASPRHASTGT